ncbi:MAG: hypothetical protein G01um10143_692, partial [Parcubacteria group bacterium Gr01-1014_3]
MSFNRANFYVKKFIALLLIVGLFFSYFSQFISSNVYAAAVPTILGYQGRLANASGDLLGSSSGTTYYFKFSIHNASSDGSQLWPTTPTEVAATVRSGVFNVNIGDVGNGYPDVLNLDFSSNPNLYLEVKVSSSSGGSFQTLSPRQLISSAAFAQLANAVSGTSSPSIFGSTTPIDFAQVTIEATTSTAIPIAIRAAAGQTADLFQIQEANDGINQIVIDSGFRFGLGTSSVSNTLGAFSFGIEGAANIGNYLNTSFITATSTTATSTFKGGVNLAREAGNVGIGTSSPVVALLAVGGNVYFSGGFSVGRTATTTEGHIGATFLHSDTKIVARGLLDCDTIDTDSNGVFKCGNDQTSAGAAGGWIDDGTVVRLDASADVVEISDLYATNSDIFIGNGLQATSTISGEYGKIGFGSTTPFGQISIEAVQGIVGSNTPIFVIGDSGSSSPVFYVSGRSSGDDPLIGIGTDTPSVSLEVLGSGIFTSNLNIGGVIDAQGAGTSTFDGGINIVSAGGLSSAQGLTISGGDIQSSGKFTQTGSATSTIPNLNISTLGSLGFLFVSGSGTSTVIDAGQLIKASLEVRNGLVLAGDLISTGAFDFTGSGTSTVSNFSATNINTTSLTLTGDLNVETTGTSSIPNLLSTNLVATSLTLSGTLEVETSGTSTFVGGISATSLILTGGLHVDTGDAIFDQKISVGSGTSTFTGDINANLLHSDTQLVLAGLPSCTGDLETDANGVVKCGTDQTGGSAAGSSGGVQFNNAGSFGATSALIVSGVDTFIGGDLNVSGGDFNIGNGLQATGTISGEYGKIGFGSSTPYAQVAIEVAGTIVGSTTPVFVVADTGTNSPLFLITSTGRIGIATNTPTVTANPAGAASGLSVATSTYIDGGLGIGGATSTNGGLFVKNSLDVYEGITLRRGRLEVSGTATSTLPNLNASTISSTALLYVSGAATSTLEGGLKVNAVGGITSMSGLTISAGDIQSAGKLTITSLGTSTLPALTATDINTTSLTLGGTLEVTTTGTSTFAGGISAAGLTSTAGLNISTGDAIFAQTIDVGAGTSTFSGNIKAGLLHSDT